MTWADVALESALWAAIVAAPIAALLGLLPRSNTRSILIWAWALLPVFLELVALLILPFGVCVFSGVLLLIALPSWAGLSVLGFAAVLRLRHMSGGAG